MGVVFITDPDGEQIKLDDERPFAAMPVNERLLLMIDSYQRHGEHEKAEALHEDYLGWKMTYANSPKDYARAQREADREMRRIHRERAEANAKRWGMR